MTAAGMNGHTKQQGRVPRPEDCEGYRAGCRALARLRNPQPGRVAEDQAGGGLWRIRYVATRSAVS